MWKWYTIIAVLAFALICSIGSCSTSAEKIESLTANIGELESELSQTEQNLTELQHDYDTLRENYTVLQGTKEMVFGEGVRLFDMGWKPGYWGILEGKVQNVGDKPMPSVEIWVVEYNQDGSLGSVHSTYAKDLYPQEVAEWSISSIFLENGTLYEREVEDILGICAFGSK